MKGVFHMKIRKLFAGLMACLLLETNVIVYYLPFLILSGVIAGVVIGVVSAIMVDRVQVEC